MSQPQMVEAIETLFEPVVIYNNHRGKDAQILKQFREPSWNYQVVRFIDASGTDIIPRKDRVWSLEALADRMVTTLQKQNREVPNYLRALVGTASVGNPGKAAFAMHCFWTGEYHLGGLDGVLTTEAGWFDGREVTLVEFDRDRIAFAELLKNASSVKCANKVYTTTAQDQNLAKQSSISSGELKSGYRPASANDQKRQILGSDFHKVGLSPIQATKVNAFARRDMTTALSWLSPEQIKKLQ